MSGNGELMLRSVLQVLGRQHVIEPEAARALGEGYLFWREFYGERMVEEVRRNLRVRGRRLTAVRGAMALARYHPALAWHQLLRKARVVAARARRPGLNGGFPTKA